MPFASLADADDAFKQLSEQLEILEALNVAATTVLGVLISKHPDYQQVQLLLTSAIEAADLGSWTKILNARQREVARNYLEALQQAPQSTGQIRPLG